MTDGFVGQSLPKFDIRFMSASHLIATKSRTSPHFGFGSNRVTFAMSAACPLRRTPDMVTTARWPLKWSNHRPRCASRPERPGS